MRGPARQDLPRGHHVRATSISIHYLLEAGGYWLERSGAAA